VGFLTLKKYKQESKKTVLACSLIAAIVGSVQTAFIVHEIKKKLVEQDALRRNELIDGRRSQS
jgi:hypothetical protein